MSEKISPLPWTRDKYNDVNDAHGERVNFRNLSLLTGGPAEVKAEAAANTDYIVLAANAFPALVGALERAAEALEGVVFEDSEDWGNELMNDIHSALAFAKGEPHD